MVSRNGGGARHNCTLQKDDGQRSLRNRSVFDCQVCAVDCNAEEHGVAVRHFCCQPRDFGPHPERLRRARQPVAPVVEVGSGPGAASFDGEPVPVGAIRPTAQARMLQHHYSGGHRCTSEFVSQSSESRATRAVAIRQVVPDNGGE